MQVPKNLAEVVRFVHHVVFELDANFHPDTDFRDYTKPNGTPSFDGEAADELNAALAQAFEVCDLHKADIYDLTMPVMRARLTA